MDAVLTRRPRRTLALLVALALLTAACGGGDDDPAPGSVGNSLTTGGGATTTPTGGSATTTQDGGAVTLTTRKPSSGLPNDNTSTSDDATLRAAARGVPGGFAGILLAPSAAGTLVLDLLVQSGAAAPDPATVAAIRDLLGAVSGKPVTVRGPTTFQSASTVHSADDVRRLGENEGRAQGSGAGVIHVLYLRGQFSDDSALGVTARGDTMAIFPDQLSRVASPLVSRSRLERAVVTHELGHVLGLVDIYLDENRADPEHPGHSSNPRSVMYWAVESDLVGQVLGGPPPIAFDAADQNDLRKIREGAPREVD